MFPSISVDPQIVVVTSQKKEKKTRTLHVSPQAHQRHPAKNKYKPIHKQNPILTIKTKNQAFNTPPRPPQNYYPKINTQQDQLLQKRNNQLRQLLHVPNFKQIQKSKSKNKSLPYNNPIQVQNRVLRNLLPSYNYQIQLVEFNDKKYNQVQKIQQIMVEDFWGYYGYYILAEMYDIDHQKWKQYKNKHNSNQYLLLDRLLLIQKSRQPQYINYCHQNNLNHKLNKTIFQNIKDVLENKEDFIQYFLIGQHPDYSKNKIKRDKNVSILAYSYLIWFCEKAPINIERKDHPQRFRKKQQSSKQLKLFFCTKQERVFNYDRANSTIQSALKYFRKIAKKQQNIHNN